MFTGTQSKVTQQTLVVSVEVRCPCANVTRTEVYWTTSSVLLVVSSLAFFGPVSGQPLASQFSWDGLREVVDASSSFSSDVSRIERRRLTTMYGRSFLISSLLYMLYLISRRTRVCVFLVMGVPRPKRVDRDHAQSFSRFVFRMRFVSPLPGLVRRRPLEECFLEHPVISGVRLQAGPSCGGRQASVTFGFHRIASRVSREQRVHLLREFLYMRTGH